MSRGGTVVSTVAMWDSPPDGEVASGTKLETEFVEGVAQEGKYGWIDGIADRKWWICYRQEGERKVPYCPDSDGRIKTTDPTSLDDAGTLLDAHDAVKTSKAKQGEDDCLDGFGIVIHEETDLVGIDLDNVVDGDAVANWAVDVVDQIGSYAELSPSGSGLHILAWAPDGIDESYSNRGDVGDENQHIEIYDSDRYFTFTAESVDRTDNEIVEAGAQVRDLQRALCDLRETPEGEQSVNKQEEDPETGENNKSPIGGVESVSSKQRSGGQSDRSDQELITQACQADDDFRSLWEGDSSTYESRSEADQALANKLIWWTETDYQRTKQLMRESALYREKFDEERGDGTYLDLTVDTAVKMNG
jgi:primase-polymerase (primpol)-like protein